jgi:hypothetical protein
MMMLKRRTLMASVNGMAGFSLLSAGTILVLILFNAHTYNRLTSETELVKVEIGSRSQQGISIKLKSSEGEQLFFIDAAEWQLDARFLKWKAWAYLLGSEPLVRLETLSGRLSSVVSGAERLDSHKLLQNNPLLSDFGSKISNWLGMVDSYYGSSIYMPAVEGSVYTVSATVSGLIARAENNTAKEAVYRWMMQ